VNSSKGPVLSAFTAWAGSSFLLSGCHTEEDMIGEPNWIVEGAFDKPMSVPPSVSGSASLSADFSTAELLKGRPAMHIHGVQFQVLHRMGGRNTIIASEKGWKDTVLVMPGEKVQVIMTFPDYKGTFVFHCHNLEHEDDGMMLNYQIV